MNTDTIKAITQIVFAVVILFMMVISLLSVYVFIRYGRTRSLTLLMSLVFGGVFLFGALGAYWSLTQIF